MNSYRDQRRSSQGLFTFTALWRTCILLAGGIISAGRNAIRSRTTGSWCEGTENTILFLGYSNSDPHFRQTILPLISGAESTKRT